MATETIQKLQRFGLSEKEADIYLALLHLGTVPASDIAKKSGVNRSTAYVVLESLTKKGLAAIEIRDGVRSYSPASPDRLVQKAEDSAREHAELAKLGREMLSELETIEKSKDSTKPNIKFFEGIAGIKTAYENMLLSKEPIFSYATENELIKEMPNYISTVRERQAKRNVSTKILSHNTSQIRDLITKNASGSIEYALIPESGFGSELAVYGNQTTFISPREKFACTVESVEFANGIKTLLLLALQKAKLWNVRAENNDQKIPKKKHSALVKAEKRFWKI